MLNQTRRERERGWGLFAEFSQVLLFFFLILLILFFSIILFIFLLLLLSPHPHSFLSPPQCSSSFNGDPRPSPDVRPQTPCPRLWWAEFLLPEDIHLILERLSFVRQRRQLLVLRLDVQQLLLQLLAADPVVILGRLQPEGYTVSFQSEVASPCDTVSFSSSSSSSSSSSCSSSIPEGFLL